ncbi:MAG: anthranilate synthase component 1 [Saprospiraceae bacterium]|jgi:anthranilate synthase component 1
MKYNTVYRKMIGDINTLVGMYLKLRDRYSQVQLLETSSYATKEDSLSFIAFDVQATLVVNKGVLSVDGIQKADFDIAIEIANFMDSIELNADDDMMQHLAILGYSGYDAVQQYETIKFDPNKEAEGIPELRYDFYRYLIVMDHFHEEIYIIDNVPDGEEDRLDEVVNIINHRDVQTYAFSADGPERSNMTDQDYMDMVTKGKEHCKRGDVFQIVLARKFHQDFKGDEFNVYRALRSINPSPYLFYFDYGTFKILGSSPEAQLIVKDQIAEIHPIAGTFRRTGDPKEDERQAELLSADPKETSEHVMLVDLARNDLSKNTDTVSVDVYKEIQYFSHVIHLVSKVTGRLKKGSTAFEVFADTFPAGTLSGAPKFKAMSLINTYEKDSRSFYGGGIGLIFFNGNLNHAIIIRSFLSKGGTLTRQAGAGIVIGSREEGELQEVNHKLAALKKAIVLAETL